MRKIAINKKITDDIFEKKKEEKDSNKITNKANYQMHLMIAWNKIVIQMELGLNMHIAAALLTRYQRECPQRSL